MPESGTDNYWGTFDFSTRDDSAPAALLKHQADKLREVTGGQVEGSVEEDVQGGTVFASLYAGVPDPLDYQFKVVYVAFPITADPANPSPITVEDSFGGGKKVLRDMREFDHYLRDLLASGPVRAAIGNLIRYGASRVAL